MNCPACNAQDIDHGIENCPQCGSGLKIFEHVNTVNKQLKNRQLSIIILLVLLVLTGAGWVITSMSGNPGKHTGDNLTEQTVIDTSELQTIRAENTQLLHKIEELEANIEDVNLTDESDDPDEISEAGTEELQNELEPDESVSSNATVSSSVYVVKKGETLFNIAKNTLGNGKKYTEIAEANNLHNPNIILIGQKLTIKQ